MANYAIILGVVLIASQVLTRNIQRRASPTGQSIKNVTSIITYNELLYILDSRHGSIGKKPTHLTPCARAILSCCENLVMNELCSESLKCGAYFFDDNPCEDKFIVDALDAAKLFYDQFLESKL